MRIKAAKNPIIYISLYGIASSDELKKSLFAAAYPIISGKGAKFAGTIAKSALSYLNFSTDLRPEQFIAVPRDKVIVVDDLERCSMPLNEVLGCLNALVEQDKHKLIILGNEEEIAKEELDSYRRRREKLIGQLMNVKSDVQGAYALFIESLQSTSAQAFLRKKAPQVLSIYRQSGTENLRILQQSMWVFERVYNSLSPELRKNEEAMLEALELLLVFCIEYKAGNLAPEDIKQRLTGLIFAAHQLNSKRSDEVHCDKIDDISNKYACINLRNEILSNDVLCEVIVEGRVDASRLSEDLLSSRHYNELQQEEPWRTVWHGVDRTIEAFEDAQKEMRRAFLRREYTQPGIIMHVVALNFWLSDMGYLDESREDLVLEAKEYIDELFEEGHFKVSAPLSTSAWGLLESDGLGFLEKDTVEFKEVYEYLVDRLRAAAQKSRVDWASELRELLAAEPSKFFRQVCFNDFERSRFYREPVLHLIDSKEFVEIALNLGVADYQLPFLALKTRYENGELQGDLAEEKSWALEVRDVLVAREAAAKGITKFKLGLLDKWYLAPFLKPHSERQQVCE